MSRELSEDEHSAYHLEIGLRGCGVEGCDPDLGNDPWVSIAHHFQAVSGAPEHP